VVVIGGLPALVSKAAQLAGIRQACIGRHHCELADGINFRAPRFPLGESALVAQRGGTARSHCQRTDGRLRGCISAVGRPSGRHAH
jgi:hypothetical protein